jgi:hypothetical protein
MKLVIVEWRDIIQTSGWEPHEDVRCPTIRSVGWLVEQDDPTTIKICNTLAPENFEDKGNKEYGITAFPKGCVTKLEFLTCQVSNVLD